MTPYLDVTDATAYFDTRLWSDAWTNSIESDQTKALARATRVINRLNFRGEKTLETQDNQFPRDGDTDVPTLILEACCEIALAFLDGIDVDLEYEATSINASGMKEVRATYDRATKPEYYLAGVPCYEAWLRLKPFLRDINFVNISRG